MVCGADSLMKKKLQLYSGKSPDVQLFFINSLSEIDEADLLILQAGSAGEFFSRRTEASPPVICFGASSDIGNCLSAGCVDYLCSPWTADEFFERARRGCGIWKVSFKNSCLVLRGDCSLRLVKDKGVQSVSTVLTASEQRILKLFLQNRGSYFDREMLTEILSGKLPDDSRKIDMLISRLRKKISLLTAESCGLIKNQHGRGWGIM